MNNALALLDFASATYKKATNLIKICGFFIIIILWIPSSNPTSLNLLL